MRDAWPADDRLDTPARWAGVAIIHGLIRAARDLAWKVPKGGSVGEVSNVVSSDERAPPLYAIRCPHPAGAS